MASNLFVRNMDVGVPRAGDNRRLEVVVDGLLLFNGRQLAVDTTLVSTLKGNGEPGEVQQTAMGGTRRSSTGQGTNQPRTRWT